MRYRRFGPLDWEASILGLGAAMLPEDRRASIELIRCAIDHGVNYFDLGYPYNMERHDRLAAVVAEALNGAFRDRVRVAVTLPSDLIHSTADLDRYLSRQLEKTGLDRADFCLFGRLNRGNWPVLEVLGALKWVETAIRDGRIGGMGFSFHDHYQPLKSIVESYDHWVLGQFQFSFMDIRHDPGISGIKYAARKGLAVVVNEPLKTGRLLRDIPQPAAQIYAGAAVKRSLAEWCLKFVWNYPEVTTIVGDIASTGEFMESLTLADSAGPDSYGIEEEVLISSVRDAYLALRQIQCSSCQACMPCPEEIDVPRIFELYNDALMYGDLETARLIYANERHNAHCCTECFSCENRCAKRLPVIEWLRKSCRLLANCK